MLLPLKELSEVLQLGNNLVDVKAFNSTETPTTHPDPLSQLLPI